MFVDEAPLVAVVHGGTSPVGEFGLPRQSQHTVHPPPGDDLMLVDHVERQEFGAALALIKELGSGVQILAQTPDGHVRVRAVEDAIVAVDCQVEATRHIVALVSVFPPVPPDDFGGFGDGEAKLLVGGRVGSPPTGRWTDNVKTFVTDDHKANHHIDGIEKVGHPPPEKWALDGKRLDVQALDKDHAPDFQRVETRRRGRDGRHEPCQVRESHWKTHVAAFFGAGIVFGRQLHDRRPHLPAAAPCSSLVTNDPG